MSGFTKLSFINNRERKIKRIEKKN